MANVTPSVWYVNFGNGSSTGYYAASIWIANHSYTPGALVRQTEASASVTATISTTTMTISAVLSGTVTLGQQISGTGITGTPTITAFGTFNGTSGTVTISSSQTVSSGETITCIFVVGNERMFVCTTSGTSSATEPLWTLTHSSSTTDNTLTWMECAGNPAVNGDVVNTVTWTQQHTSSTTVTTGLIIYDSATASFQIITTAGTIGASSPSFSATAGTITTDNTAHWTSLGASSGFGAWGSPMPRLFTIMSGWQTAGNTVFIGDNNAETYTVGSITYSGTTTGTNPLFVYCVDHTASVPPTSSNLKTTGSITVSGSNSFFIEFNVTGLYVYGISFSAQDGITWIIGTWHKFDACAFIKTGTNGSGNAMDFIGSNYLDLANTTFQFGSTSDGINLNSVTLLTWRNTTSAIQGSTIPTTLFNTTANTKTLLVEGVDLSAITGTILSNTNTNATYAYFIDCAFAAGVTVSSNPALLGQSGTYVSRSDSAATDYQAQIYAYQGTLTTSTTIARSSGASDGVTPVSWNMTTTANTSWFDPFTSFPITIWNTEINVNATVTLHGIWDSTTLPNNDQIWISVAYMGSAITPLASFQTDTKANGLATGIALTQDTTSNWTIRAIARQNNTVYAVGNTFSVSSNPSLLFYVSAIGSSPHQSASSLPAGYASAVMGGSVTDGNLTVIAMQQFLLTVTLTSPQPQLTGYLRVYVKAALASSTFYVDPLVVLS